MGPATVSQPTPLLRAPPFPGYRPGKAEALAGSAVVSETDAEAVVEAMREARVGGTFWGNPVQLSDELREAVTVVRSRSQDERDRLVTNCGTDKTIAVEATEPDDPVDPWSILPQAAKLVAHGDDEWVAIAAVLGLEVDIISSGRFGEPGEKIEELKKRAAEAIMQPFADPFSGSWIAPLKAISLLSEWRRVIDANRGEEGHRLVAACGISWWKRFEIERFLWSPGPPLRIFRSSSRALAYAQRQGGALAIWPSRISRALVEDARRRNVPLVRVEDGFVRSVGLGSNLVPPLSVIVDRTGIHFDPSMASDLERILSVHAFSASLIERARRLRETIVAAGISKYASGHYAAARDQRDIHAKRIILVPGQVEDDMSVLAGGGGLTSNLELLRRVREHEPDAEIWWRPHPDVDAGHRNGFVDDTVALQFADKIVREGSMADLLDQVDNVHVLTSLSGFEALLRGRDVTCHGTPFYAGWGLTRDLGEVPDRRGRTLKLDQLVAGVLLLYPRYLDPVTGLPCPPEILIQRMSDQRTPNRLQWVAPLRRAQGIMMARLRRRKPR
ncbi:capsule polysaccharide export protein [Erythrobacter sp. NAP1]|uniref:capsular polysaccharide export protein, LipB/KpsS family n=1 Tax=Erythrobacter sp. NAP1 TaxID=237727 RepID=UPI00006875DD|nr:capsule polysaccharide transporter [Erythrobacter sp. NAP1]EAQ29009.1 capsule polysaccharide export protein [Erythrobacter sp. NAP1]